MWIAKDCSQNGLFLIFKVRVVRPHRMEVVSHPYPQSKQVSDHHHCQLTNLHFWIKTWWWCYFQSFVTADSEPRVWHQHHNLRRWRPCDLSIGEYPHKNHFRQTVWRHWHLGEQKIFHKNTHFILILSGERSVGSGKSSLSWNWEDQGKAVHTSYIDHFANIIISSVFRCSRLHPPRDFLSIHPIPLRERFIKKENK